MKLNDKCAKHWKNCEDKRKNAAKMASNIINKDYTCRFLVKRAGTNYKLIVAQFKRQGKLAQGRASDIVQ